MIDTSIELRGSVEGEVLTNEFEMVENVFEAALTRARHQMDIPHFRNIFATSIRDTYLHIDTTNTGRE